jgi:hypothetical protein
LEFSILPRGSVGSVDSGGGVLLSIEVFWNGLDGQVSVFNKEIVSLVGVALVFIVSSSIAVDFEVPFGSIKRVSIEFVLPYQVVLLSMDGRDEREGQYGDD